MNKSILASSQWLDGKIQGKSIKFNQLVQNGDFADVSIWGGAGTYTVSNNVGELSSTGDIRQTISLINGNKYLAIVDVYGKSTNQFLFIQGIGNTRHTNTDDYTWETLSLFFTSSLTSASFSVINNESFYCRFRKYMCFNLTLLFGSGQEPSTLSEFYATDLGKAIQNGWYPTYTTGGILSATSPFAFKDSNNNTLTTYNPSPALTLRAVGKELKSLLGKQNNLQQSDGALYNWLTFSNGYWRYYTTPQVAWNITPLSQNRKYVLISKFNTLEHFRNDVIPISNGNSWNFTVSSEYRANNTIVSIITNSTFTSVITCLRYTNGASLEGTIGEYCILIDLTSIGLDNLTAQQFYDNYNQYFEKLADGQTINTLCDTLWNCSGNVERKLRETIISSRHITQYTSAGYTDVFHFTVNDKKIDLTSPMLSSIGTFVETAIWDAHYTDNIIRFCGHNTLNRVYVNTGERFNTVSDFMTFLGNQKLIYELATPTTEQHPSIAIPKLATKCTDANGMEIDIERNN